ncbi:GNAT family N-acetyltransferase [Granulicella cerasi]|uniref:GNAT family N-acetyltransferase n=1 Tax=Granulicella cerasi TaxID=741063 RepID=A0ABW1Z6I5_9BACT|nr:GNAT family N-acetyltransferase [Granulicella cerasi]
MSEIVVRPLTELAEFDQCVQLQDAVWSYDVASMVTQKVFLLASHIGGQVIGAYAGDVLAGYAMSLPGIRNGKPYLHSHHLAVLPEFRNAGVGRRLKLAQRDDAVARGIELMEWTFDPLEIKNANLNIAKLGAVIRRYKRNFYGDSVSPLHGGLPTDRIIAEWWLTSERVTKALAKEPFAGVVKGSVTVPAQIGSWKSHDAERPKAAAAQQAIANGLEQAFAQGQAVIGFEVDAEGNGKYLLGDWSEGEAR